MERLFSTVCYILNHFCWSVNYATIATIFLNMPRNWGKVYIWWILVLSFMESSIPTFQYFFQLFFIWSVNCSSHFLVPFCWSVNCIWVEPLISEMSKSLNMDLYLRAFSIAIYRKFNLYYLRLFRLFSGLQTVQFWSVNYASYFRPS